MHWALVSFTAQEDILLVSTCGMLFIVDPMSGVVKLSESYKDIFKIKGIELAKSESNFIVFKSSTHSFYVIDDVYHPDLVDLGRPDFDIDEPNMETNNESPSKRTKETERI